MPYLTLYTISSAVIGRMPGFSAVRESFIISTRRARETIAILAVFLVLTISQFLVGSVLAMIPFLGSLAALALNEALIAYMTLVVVGMYIYVHREMPTLDQTL